MLRSRRRGADPDDRSFVNINGKSSWPRRGGRPQPTTDLTSAESAERYGLLYGGLSVALSLRRLPTSNL